MGQVGTGQSGGPLMLLEELQDGQHNVVDVAEARSLRLLGVMHAACSQNAVSASLHDTVTLPEFRTPDQLLKSPSLAKGGTSAGAGHCQRAYSGTTQLGTQSTELTHASTLSEEPSQWNKDHVVCTLQWLTYVHMHAQTRCSLPV